MKTVVVRVVLFLFKVLRPPLRIAYAALFSWWLSPAFRRIGQKRSLEEIKNSAPFLFNIYGARAISDPRPEANDPRLSCIYIATSSLVFKFSEWHNEYFDVRVAPVFAPMDSYNVIDALRIADPSGRSTLPQEIEGWHQFARVLEPRFHFLEAAFNQENFQETKHEMQSRNA